MTSDFSFDGSKSFDANFETFLVAAKEIDEDLADILWNNAAALAQIVREGERDSNARASFNAGIAEALEALIAPPDPSEEE